MQSKHKVTFRKTGIGIILLCLGLMALAIFTLIKTKSELRALNEQAETMQQQVQAATEENAALQYQIEHSDDPEIMEQVIREEFGYVKPGDKVFYDTEH